MALSYYVEDFPQYTNTICHSECVLFLREMFLFRGKYPVFLDSEFRPKCEKASSTYNNYYRRGLHNRESILNDSTACVFVRIHEFIYALGLLL